MLRLCLALHLLVAVAHGVSHVHEGIFAGTLETAFIMIVYYAAPAGALLLRRADIGWAALLACWLHGGVRHFLFMSSDHVAMLPSMSLFTLTAVSLAVVDGISLLILSRAGLRETLHRAIARSDRVIGVPSDYLHHVIDTSLGAALAFLSFFVLVGYRRALPKRAWHAARITATRVADCGPCVQVTVNMALRDGLTRELVESILADKVVDEDASLACAFTRATLAWREDLEELREDVVRRFGQRGLIELGYALATSQVFPQVKRALGFARSCAHVRVEVA